MAGIAVVRMQIKPNANVFHGCELFWFMTTQHGPLIYCVNDALLVLLLPAAVGSFSFAAIQQAIKKTPLVAGHCAENGLAQ
jgi:hypothetical protein